MATLWYFPAASAAVTWRVWPPATPNSPQVASPLDSTRARETPDLMNLSGKRPDLLCFHASLERASVVPRPEGPDAPLKVKSQARVMAVSTCQLGNSFLGPLRCGLCLRAPCWFAVNILGPPCSGQHNPHPYLPVNRASPATSAALATTTHPNVARVTAVNMRTSYRS